MSTFTLDNSKFDENNFIIRIMFPNELNIYFESDLGNISSEEIKAFMKLFYKNKNCKLDILNSKKNTVKISYNSKESKIYFKTFNEGYIFSDIDYNYNSVNIGFKINQTERENFYSILEKLYELKCEDDEDYN